MNTQTANYECVRGHITTILSDGERVQIAIICAHTRKDGKICKESAYYQPTDAELDAAAREELKRPRTQVVYSASAQMDVDDTCYPYGK